MREFPVKIKNEIWCYQHLTNSKKLLIFNADKNEVSPELSMLINEDGILTHGSLMAGKISVHQVQSQNFNPFSIPLTEPKDQMPIINLKDLKDSASAVQKFLENNSVKTMKNFSLFESQSLVANAALQPWRGFWWPRKNMPILGPLSKYDRYVQAHGGINPGVASWESLHHAYHGVGWSGHCNGWAASAILHSEPRIVRTDPSSGIVFSISDQKGILAEADYCVNAAFFGHRNYGDGNNGDISPDLFHKTLIYYIGSLHKPIAMDYRSDAAVDNHIVSGYSMQIMNSGENIYTVTATLSMHGYDNASSEVPGVARSYTRVYKYILRTDSQGNPVSGRWLSANPDFMWVPLSPMNCQKLDYTYINSILSL